MPSELDLTGKWLSSLQAEENKPEAGSESAGSTQPFDWISGLSEQGDFTPAETEADHEDRPIMEAGEAPSWLGDSGQKSSEGPTTGGVPAWLAGDTSEPRPTQSETPPAAPAEPEPVVDLPEWLAGLDEEKHQAVPAAASSDDVPVWLRSENEPTPAVAERTHAADWHPAEPAERPKPETPPEKVEKVAVAPALAAATGVGPGPEGGVRPPLPSRPRPTQVPPKATGPAQTSLEAAESELGRGNIAAALDLFARLIRKGKSLEEIIRDLRDALYRYPVEVPIWQALGDAYMRANRLQEALDAYTKAEELLR